MYIGSAFKLANLVQVYPITIGNQPIKVSNPYFDYCNVFGKNLHSKGLFSYLQKLHKEETNICP